MEDKEQKPRSMAAPIRNVIRSNDSASLWNFTISPGWAPEECDALYKAVMKEGMGNWRTILKKKYLPGKTRTQICLQAQRMLGQQSLAEFEKLHIDMRKVYAENTRKTNVVRKAGVIVNVGSYPTKEELRKRKEENAKKFGLTKEQVDAIIVPTVARDEVLDATLSAVAVEEESYKLQESASLKSILPALYERHSMFIHTLRKKNPSYKPSEFDQKVLSKVESLDRSPANKRPNPSTTQHLTSTNTHSTNPRTLESLRNMDEPDEGRDKYMSKIAKHYHRPMKQTQVPIVTPIPKSSSNVRVLMHQNK